MAQLRADGYRPGLRSARESGDLLPLTSVESGGFAKDASGPRAMTRVIRLCETLAGTPAGLTLSELSDFLETPKSTLLNSLRPLVQDDFLIVEGPLYRLGPGAFRMAAQIGSAWSLPRLMSVYLRELAEATGESVGIAVPDWTAKRAVYIETIQSSRPVLYAMRAGDTAPLYASSAGHVMLAHATIDYIETYFETTRFKRLTPNTVIDPTSLRRELGQARAQGYWLSVGQLLEDTATVAAPIFNAQSQIVAAIAIGGPADRLMAGSEDSIRAICRITKRASAQLALEK